MTKIKKAWVAATVLASLLAVSGDARQSPGVKTIAADRESRTQASTISLDSLDGLEVHSIQEDGVDPVKTKAEVGTYRGRRAARIVNVDGLTAAGTPAGA